MNNMSIRLRLTLMIVVVTALISAVGVALGVGVLETDVRDAAIRERIEQVEGFAEEIENFPEDTTLIDDTVVIVDPFDDSLGDEVFGELDFLAGVVELLLDDSGVESAAGSGSGELFVWFGPGQVLAMSPNDVRDATAEELAGRAPIPVNDLFELGFLPFEFLENDGESSSQDFRLEVAKDVIGGQELTFIAEVTDELDALDAIRDTLRLVVIGLTLFAGIATWFIAGRALRPVGAITTQVREISSGTLSERVPEPSTEDEIGVLARTMNTMLGRLEMSDLRRRQFVSDASHELRTPVAVLRSEAEVARRAPESTSIEDLSSVVLGESKRLEGLVEDLLSLARGDESRPSSATQTIDVDEIVLEESARSRSLPVDKRAVSAGRVVGHYDDLQRTIAHLLDNAARHGETTIAIGVQTMGDVVRLWVDDDGGGIDSAERDRVFGRFIRLDDARTRDSGGAGLGLAVVSETVERMGGTIEVLDAPLGGARFQIELPAA